MYTPVLENHSKQTAFEKTLKFLPGPRLPRHVYKPVVLLYKFMPQCPTATKGMHVKYKKTHKINNPAQALILITTAAIRERLLYKNLPTSFAVIENLWTGRTLLIGKLLKSLINNIIPGVNFNFLR